MATEEELLSALHRDQTGLAEALAEVVRTCNGYSWIAEGRGMYDYDDDGYRKEVGRCLEEIKAKALMALRDSGKLAHHFCCQRPRLQFTLKAE